MLNFFEAWKWPGREEILEFAYLMPLHMSTIYSTSWEESARGNREYIKLSQAGVAAELN